MRLNELDIAGSMAAYAPNLTAPGAARLPAEAMANWVNKEIAVAKLEGPPFRP